MTAAAETRTATYVGGPLDGRTVHRPGRTWYPRLDTGRRAWQTTSATYHHHVDGDRNIYLHTTEVEKRKPKPKPAKHRAG